MNDRESSLVGVCCRYCFNRESRRGKIIYKKRLRSFIKRDLKKVLKDY